MPETTIMLDNSRSLSTSWNFGLTNNAAVIIVVGRDSEIKFFRIIKTQDECREVVSSLQRIIEYEISK